MKENDYENEIAQLRGQLKAANILIGSLIANLEKNASYKLTATLSVEVNLDHQKRLDQVEVSESGVLEYKAEREFIEEAIAFAETLRYRPFRIT